MNEEQKTKLEQTISYALNRLKEPSTWAGMALFVGFFGLDADTVDRIIRNGPAVAAAVGALAAIFLPSSKHVVLTTVAGDKVATDAPAGSSIPSASVADWAENKPIEPTQ